MQRRQTLVGLEAPPPLFVGGYVFLERPLYRGEVIGGRRIGGKNLMQLSKERKARRLSRHDDRHDPRPAPGLPRQMQSLLVFQLLPRTYASTRQEQHRVGAGNRLGQSWHPIGAGSHVARRKIAFGPRSACRERRFHRPRLVEIGRVIADEDPHAAPFDRVIVLTTHLPGYR